MQITSLPGNKNFRLTSAPATVAALLAMVCTLGLAGSAAAQAVTSIDDVSPADLPFVDGDQGIPTGGSTVITAGVDANGNLVDIFGAPLLDEQGRVVGQFNYERSANIEVGRYSSGQLFMDGGAVLRFGDLVIGGDTLLNEVANNLDIDGGDLGAGSSSASGTVEISGQGTIYNNHPGIVPTIYQDPGNPETTSFVVPVAYDPNPDQGGVLGNADEITNIQRGDDQFDLYVGLTGSGLLRILDQGRAEIRDGAFIGAGPNAVGTVDVDGPGSYLGIFGMKNPVTLGGGISETVIGAYGVGHLNITNGGRVDSFNRAALGAIDASGDDGMAFNRGGHGHALVEGSGSTWRIFTQDDGGGDDANGLAIGEYFEEGDIDNRIDTLFTDLDAYEGDDGRGTLVIRNQGLVTVQLDEITDDTDNDEASVRIGLYGELQLTGGRIEIRDRLDNDGLIRTGDNQGGESRRGDGVIETGTFLNSPIGQIRVRAGEHLQIRSLAGDETDDANMLMAGGVVVPYFYANTGKIEVLGDVANGKAELEFLRDPVPAAPGVENRFQNLLLAGVPGVGGLDAMMMPIAGDVRGQIKAQDANLFFRSNFLNQADVLFVGGDNVVVGEVENEATGVISIVNESHVTFQDRVVNDGIILLNDESDVTFAAGLAGAGALIDLNPAAISVIGDFQTDGLLDFVIGGGPTGLDFTRLGVTGDATFGLTSTIAIDALSLTGVVAGSSFDLISVSGAVVDLGLTTISLPTAPTGLTFMVDAFVTNPGQYTLSVEAISAMAIGADFNGDGIVDATDLAIWQMNFGITDGATIANGDADGDGDVDAADFVIINMQFGGMGMAVPFTGPGVGSFVVPEPSAGLLLLVASCGCFLRRHRRC